MFDYSMYIWEKYGVHTYEKENLQHWLTHFSTGGMSHAKVMQRLPLRCYASAESALTQY